jgi:signal transduction histidine kinase
MNRTITPEIEIHDIPPLSPGETSLLDMHSLLNLLNVLHGELYLLGAHLPGTEEILRPALDQCSEFRRHLEDPDAALRDAANLSVWRAGIELYIAEALAAQPALADTPDIRESVDNIQSVFAILAVRAAEILARARAPLEWVRIPIAELREDFRAVFAAIERNSHGRYRIIYNLAQQQPRDYYVDFVIESRNQHTLALPLVFKDVMRDLMANARKYTRPGGSINAGLCETDTHLKFAVTDTGCGIPPDELETVVHYGRRGSNVADIRTMGGGFGLTKAFLVTKRFGGRFWICSAPGVGTGIRIELPLPAKGGGSDRAS